MTENPLLPHRKLQELYTLLTTCARLDSKARRTGSAAVKSREAILAAAALYLESGDRFSVPFQDPASSLRPEPLRKLPSPPAAWVPPRKLPRLLLDASSAATLKTSGDRAVLAFTTQDRSEPAWPDALTWAHTELLPLILVIADSTGPRAMLGTSKVPRDASKPTWPAVQHLCSRLQLPIVTVDGLDAVAMSRVLQESFLRARMGGGPAVVWSVLPSPRSATPAAERPQARLRRYLRVRGIEVPR